MTTIGFIGSGNIGEAVAARAIAAGHDVVMSNSRGPRTLTDVIERLGERASADTAQGAATRGEVVVVTVPLKAYRDVPVEPLAGKVVIDTNNYYPERDGQISALDDGTATSAGLLAEHLPGSRVVKAFNHIQSDHIAEHATPSGAQDRRALAIAGDTEDAKTVVTSLIDAMGFDVVDLGELSQSWRIEPGTPGYGPRLDVPGMKDALAAAER